MTPEQHKAIIDRFMAGILRVGSEHHLYENEWEVICDELRRLRRMEVKAREIAVEYKHGECGATICEPCAGLKIAREILSAAADTEG